MKTPIQELIKQLEDLRDSISEDDAMYKGGVINSIRLAEAMIEKGKSRKVSLEIVGLYEFNDVYQVVDENTTVLFQGSKLDCIKYIENK